ncbi:MAG: SPOR domain-containing protein [Terriglobia bacterium]
MGERKHDERGLSARYLVLVFLMGVAACGVFFSLGFLVGYNERSSKNAGVTEQVTPSSVVPPTINQPLDTVQVDDQPSGGKSGAEKASPTSSSKAEKEAEAMITRSTAKADSDLPPPSAAIAHNRSAATPPGGKSTQVGMGFTVQVAASKDKGDAEKLVKELKSRGYAVFLVLPEYAKTGDNLYRVQVGPFATRGQAESVRDRIAKEGFKPFIRR